MAAAVLDLDYVREAVFESIGLGAQWQLASHGRAVAAPTRQDLDSGRELHLRAGSDLARLRRDAALGHELRDRALALVHRKLGRVADPPAVGAALRLQLLPVQAIARVVVTRVKDSAHRLLVMRGALGDLSQEKAFTRVSA